MSRAKLEFKKTEKLKMFLRAGGPEHLRCEGCKLLMRGKRFEYDHTVECWELPAELRAKFEEEGYPAEYGKLLCIPCHDEKSGAKSGERAHAISILEKSARARPKSAPLPGSRVSKWKFGTGLSAIFAARLKRFSGTNPGHRLRSFMAARAGQMKVPEVGPRAKGSSLSFSKLIGRSTVKRPGRSETRECSMKGDRMLSLPSQADGEHRTWSTLPLGCRS